MTGRENTPTNPPKPDRRLKPARGQRLSVHDLMARWGVGYDFVTERVRKGEIVALRIGRLYRFTIEAVEAYERDHSTAA